MQRILLVMDHDSVEVSAIDFACYLARTTHSDLAGIFIREKVLEFITPSGGDLTYGRKQRAKETKMDEDQAMRYFLEECALKKVKATAQIDKGEALEEVAFESRFADLLVLGPQTGSKGKGKVPSAFVKQLLERAECPVVLTPRSCEKIGEVVFCYDGSASSLFAMKQFTYLFPEYRSVKASLLEIREGMEPQTEEGHVRTMQWLKDHYEKVVIHYLGGTVKDELFTYFLKKSDLFIVMGAYGRSLFSQFFKPSSANMVMHTIDLPLFITHH